MAAISTRAMRASTRFLTLMYRSRSCGRPEIDELDGVVAGADAVDAAETLDDAHRIPVDVVVDQVVAVLEVLAFADAVGGDEEVDFAVLGMDGNLGAALGARGEIGQDVVVVASCRRWCGCRRRRRPGRCGCRARCCAHATSDS